MTERERDWEGRFVRGIRKNGTRCRCMECDVYLRVVDEHWSEGGQDGPYCEPCYDELVHNDVIRSPDKWCYRNNSNHMDDDEE